MGKRRPAVEGHKTVGFSVHRAFGSLPDASVNPIGKHKVRRRKEAWKSEKKVARNAERKAGKVGYR